MIRVYVTVGTGPFSSLIKACDALPTDQFSVLMQTGQSSYVPSNYPHYSISDRHELEMAACDLVVTHCGAGTVFRLLEIQKKFVAVPNLERVDRHQSDLAWFLESNNYATVCGVDKLTAAALHDALHAKVAPYVKDEFFGAQYVQMLIDRSGE